MRSRACKCYTVLSDPFSAAHWFTNLYIISMYPSFVTHLPEDGHMSSRNMQETYYVYNTLSRISVYLLFSATISSCTVCLKKIKPIFCLLRYYISLYRSVIFRIQFAVAMALNKALQNVIASIN
jgi:hypothetical protein